MTTPYYLSDWSSTCNAYVFKALKNREPELMKAVLDILGEDRVLDQQFGNILGWLKDRGYGRLVLHVKRAILDYNFDTWERYNEEAHPIENPYALENLRGMYGPDYASWYESISTEDVSVAL